ncbi:MAG: SMC-Scp complex subunit ScpB [Planctomycetota bacterium]
MVWWKRKKEPLKESLGEKSSSGSSGDLRLLEAVLMVINEPISAKQLGILTGFPDPTAVRTAVSQMNQDYDRQGRAYRVEEVAGGLQLLTRKQFALWIRRSDEVPSEQLLSPAMLETLSIVAYRQPVIRAEIESIRGVACDEVLRQLIQRDLVRISGREEDLGRPFLYETTKTFLKLFGLKAVDNLPRFQKILQQESEIASRIRNTLTDEPSER